MNRMRLSFVTLLVVGLVAFAAQAQDQGTAMKASPVPDTPEWQKLKSLVGNYVPPSTKLPDISLKLTRLTGN